MASYLLEKRVNAILSIKLRDALPVTLLIVLGAAVAFLLLRDTSSDSGPPLVDELVDDKNVYYGTSLLEAQKYVDFTVAVPEYLPEGYTMSHVRITRGISSSELHLQAGFTKDREGRHSVFNYIQGPYPDVGDTWNAQPPKELGGLSFPVKYKQGYLGLWTHWEVQGVAYTMLVLGEHESDLVEVRKVIGSIPYHVEN